MKLTFVEWFMNLFGFGYIANPKSKEIHRLSTKHVNCRLNLIKRKNYITKKKVNELMNSGEEWWNGCRYCFKEKDTG